MPTTKPARPRQVTFAGWVIVVGSVLLVVSAFERVAGLHSLETREAIARFLSEPPGDGLGLSVDGARSILRALSLVAGAAAAAAAILGVQALGRSRSARVALTALAVPLLVGGMAAAGFVASLVVASVAMLWLQPAKDWFNGVSTPTTRPSSAQTAREVEAAPPTTASPLPPPAPGMPPPVIDWPRRPRPSAVTGACVVTWVTCGLALLLMAMSVLVMIAAPDMVLDEVRRQDPSLAGDLTASDLQRYTFVGCGIAGLWCAGAVGFAVGTFLGRQWGWVGLLAVTAAAALASAVLLIGSFVMMVPLAASAVTLGLLLRPESRAWCRSSRRGHGSVAS